MTVFTPGASRPAALPSGLHAAPLPAVLRGFDAGAIALILGLWALGAWMIATQPVEVWVDYYLGIARSLAEGEGSRFLPPLETNGYQPLWQSVLASSAWLFGTSDVALALQLNTLVFGATLAFMLLAASRFPPGCAAAAAVLALRQPDILLLGMETVLLPALAIFYLAERAWRRRALLASLIVLARLDALALIAGAAAFDLLARRKIDWKAHGVLSAVLAAYFAANALVFGAPVPVSGLAKAIGASLGENVAPLQFFWAYLRKAGWLVAVLLAAWLAARRPLKLRYPRELAACAIACIVCMAYYTLFSGWGVWAWYYWPGLLLMFFLSAELLAQLDSAMRGRGWAWQAGGAAAAMLGLLLYGGRAVEAVEARHASLPPFAPAGVAPESWGARNVRLARWIEAQAFPPDTVFAMGDRAGSLGFFLGPDRLFLHTEGLVASKAYLDAMKRGEGLEFADRLGVDVWIADRTRFFEDHHVIGLAEPIQGRSARVGPYLVCFRRQGLLYAERAPATPDWPAQLVYVIDDRARTSCPAWMQAKFDGLVSRYEGLVRYTFTPGPRINEEAPRLPERVGPVGGR
jgi:hypothetical protein